MTNLSSTQEDFQNNEFELTDALTAFELLNDEQVKFICNELGIDEETIKAMSDDDFSDLYDKIADIEISETIKAGEGELSKRGLTAADIVTVIGNEIYYDVSEDDYD